MSLGKMPAHPVDRFLWVVLWLPIYLFIVGPFWHWPVLSWTKAWPVIQKEKLSAFALLPSIIVVVLSIMHPEWIRPPLEKLFIHRFEKNWPLLYPFVLLMLAPLHIFFARLKIRPEQTTSHGSAKWGAAKDTTPNLISKNTRGGLMLGRVEGGVSGKLDPRYRVDAHVLTCAPTGTGKGIGCVIPNLLEYPGSIVCLDVKGENFAVTARRRIELRQNVYALDPFRVIAEQRHRFNPIDAIDLSDPEAISTAAMLADTLVIRSGTDSHWDDSAKNLIQGLILHVATRRPEERHLGTVRALLSQPAPALFALMDELGEDIGAGFGAIARTANTFVSKADRERSSILSTAQRHTAFLDDPRVVHMLSASDFDWSELKTRAASVYLILPPDKIRTYNRISRLILGVALQTMMRDRIQPNHPVLFLLDEFAQLDHFTAVEDGISILRGYGVRLWLFVQDLSQLEAVYPKWRTFLANSVLQTFGSQDVQTTRYVSEAIGTTSVSFTTTAESQNRPSGGFSGSPGNDGRSTNQQIHSRPLLMPDEVRRLPPTTVLVLEQGKNAQRLRRLNYLRDPEIQGAFEPNPFYTNAAPAGRTAVRRTASDTSL